MQLNICKQNRSKQKRLLGPFPKFWKHPSICRACHDRCKLSSSDAAKIACHRWMMTINHWKSIGNRKGWSLFPSQKWGLWLGLKQIFWGFCFWKSQDLQMEDLHVIPPSNTAFNIPNLNKTFHDVFSSFLYPIFAFMWSILSEAVSTLTFYKS